MKADVRCHRNVDPLSDVTLIYFTGSRVHAQFGGQEERGQCGEYGRVKTDEDEYGRKADSVHQGSQRAEIQNPEAGAAVQREGKCTEVKRCLMFASYVSSYVSYVEAASHSFHSLQ